MEMIIPETELHATVRVLSLDNGLEEIKQNQYFTANLAWYMEKQFPDRRVLMDLHTRNSEPTLRCFCELNSNVCLLFVINSVRDITEFESESLWRVCRHIGFEKKCLDAFNCLKIDVSATSDSSTPTKRKWKEPTPDLGGFEWKSFGLYALYAPAEVEVECCAVCAEGFVFDLPGKRHYVTVEIFDADSDVLDNQADFLEVCESRQGDVSPDEKLKRKYVKVLKQWVGFDWFIDEKFPDRRLLIEHRHQSEECEGIACYCAFAEGPVAVFKIRGSGAISDGETDYFLKLCKEIKVSECALEEWKTR